MIYSGTQDAVVIERIPRPFVIFFLRTEASNFYSDVIVGHISSHRGTSHLYECN